MPLTGIICRWSRVNGLYHLKSWKLITLVTQPVDSMTNSALTHKFIFPKNVRQSPLIFNASVIISFYLISVTQEIAFINKFV